jgi:hypothetical protein
VSRQMPEARKIQQMRVRRISGSLIADAFLMRRIPASQIPTV